MRVLLTIATIVVLLLLYFKTRAQTSPAFNGLNSEILSQEQMDLIYEKTKLLPDNSQLSIAIVENGKTEYIGVIREDDTLKLIDNHRSVFEIGSISKAFTSTLLSELVEQGKVALDKPFDSYLDYKAKTDKTISLEQLSNHTSGLPVLPSNIGFFALMSDNPYKDYDEAKLKKYLTEEIKLENDPGTTNKYSNLGAGLLGYVLTKVEGKSYEEMLQESIFSKYGMSSSTSLRSKTENLVKGRGGKGQEVSNWDFDVLAGAGGIFSTVEDLSRFAVAQMDTTNTVFARTHKPTYKISDGMEIGLGWHIIKEEGGDLVWHNGGTGGYTSSMAMDLKGQKAIIILSNVSAMSKHMGKMDKLCFALMKDLQQVD